ncbi:MAG: hypothetical protein MRERV_20c039 [Mycoplasmataceae bacterium RV_VA103A]|nr:MAG: hypothetical protein MRERV_20c039 [Mycoplasmataceae bacterium RV_VA103A]
MQETILELHKNGENWKVAIIINWNQKNWCKSYRKSCPNSKRGSMPPLAVFSHKAIESDSEEINLNEENFHCYDCANDILRGLETSRSGVMVKNPETLVMLRQALNRLFNP